jgi:hypothetical protein
VRHPSIPTSAFALTVAGGLWLALWSGRWRLAGLALVALGAALTPFATRPDILVGRDGMLVAIRGADGRLAAIGSAASDYELARWLEQDGDGRQAAGVRTNPSGLSCDVAGCLARAKGLRVAVPRHASALADDCAAADIVILDVPRPAGCTRPRRVVDFFDVRIAGAHALTASRDGRISAETVAAARGHRPWSPPHPWAAMRDEWGQPSASRPGSAGSRPDARGAAGGGPATEPEGTRVGSFAAPPGLAASAGSLRPEIEEEDVPVGHPDEEGNPASPRER